MSREQRGILCAALHPVSGCVLFLREVSNTSAAELETQEPATSPREGLPACLWKAPGNPLEISAQNTSGAELCYSTATSQAGSDTQGVEVSSAQIFLSPSSERPV